jgi:hypothetical protein
MRTIPIHGRRRWVSLLGSVVLIGSLGLQTTSAAKPPPTPPAPTFVDYAQCANGQPPSTSLACPDGWLNGILQASNSHYSEDQVTPQRAEVNVPTGATATHTLTFTYQARKGSAATHAYDSLATWNFTQRSADRCQALAAADCVGGAFSAFPIPDDPQVLAPFSAPSTGVTTPHMLPASTQADCNAYAPNLANPALGTYPSRCLIMYGGTITGMTVPVHDCVAAGACSTASVDDYATTTITYSVSGLPKKVQLLFGGHLALGSSGGSRTWGSGHGSSNINGGPYHIKWTASDGASIGNRDNQIMGSAIIFNDTALSTTPTPTSGTVGVTLNDTANLTGATTNATGSITFNLYDDAACTAPANYTQTVTVNGPGFYSTSPGFQTTTAGTWSWTASYTGDPNNAPSSSLCGAEAVTVNRATPSLTTTSSVTVQVGGTINDVAHLSGSFNATGAITFDLYGPNDASCATSIATLSATPATAGDGDYTSTNFTTTTAGTYRWIAHFAGDVNNQPADTACNDANESVVVAPATPSAQTTPDVQTRDNVTVSGGFGTITGTVDFALYDNDQCSGTAVFSQDNKSLVSGSATSDWTTISADGTYYWQIHYDGDGVNNAAFTSACGEATTINLP